MISSTTMIKIGRVLGNKMVDMQLSNEKLVDRGIKMVMDSVGINKKSRKGKYLSGFVNIPKKMFILHSNRRKK